jgi:hypothetical protein
LLHSRSRVLLRIQASPKANMLSNHPFWPVLEWKIWP